MQFICRDQYFTITDPILLSSQTLQHLQSDCFSDTNAIFIPDNFFNVINNTYLNTFNENLELLEFYDYLNVDEQYFMEVSHKIGHHIEHSQPDLTLVQKNILLKYYPILNYYEKYGTKNLDDENLPKYVTIYFHKNIKSYKIDDYCEYGNLEMVKYLVSIGADIHAEYDYAVRCASEYGQLEVVKYLTSIGANIKEGHDYAVRYASENGHLDVVKYLVSRGANIHSDNDYAVRWASENGHLEVVKYLVEQGANIHSDNDNAVRMASEFGHLEVIKYLVSQGANIRANNDYAVIWARQNRHLEVVKYLVSLMG